MLRFSGINVFVHWSWALVAVIQFQVRESVYSSPLWNVAEYLCLFGIVTLHEFGHALACRSVGGKAERILLWPLGGIAYVRPPQRPGAVLWSIAAGPLVNVVLIPVTLILVFWANSMGSALSDDAYNFIEMLTLINGVLLVFNMLPIYPLDGGQILHAVLWFFMGQHRSLRVAATIGLIGAGGFVLLALSMGDFWLVLIAFFMATRGWHGLKQAKVLARVMSLPRREGPSCPACREAPPIGQFWQCYCGEIFDMFATGACCPQCSGAHAMTTCPLCHEANPIAAWWESAGTLPVVRVVGQE